jgi:predicted RNA-binding Zn-ribbon protein involved in translation (DUF1610 family)
MQISQYQCSSCGSVLKETTQYIEIHSLKEECPSCGSMLADSLKRRPIKQRSEVLPQFQTADTLLRFRFDIPKIDAFLGLASTDLCCITGYDANLILTRLCVRSLLPSRYGGLNSPYVMVADTGNRSDVYGAINFARQYGMNKESVANKILVIRAFTIPQVRRLLSLELPNIIRKYQINCVIIPGLLNTIDEEPSMGVKQAKKEINKVMKTINQLSGKVLVVTSIQQGKYTDWVLSDFKKRINLRYENHGKLTAELYNQGNRNIISLTERELKIIPKR